MEQIAEMDAGELQQAETYFLGKVFYPRLLRDDPEAHKFIFKQSSRPSDNDLLAVMTDDECQMYKAFRTRKFQLSCEAVYAPSSHPTHSTRPNSNLEARSTLITQETLSSRAQDAGSRQAEHEEPRLERAGSHLSSERSSQRSSNASSAGVCESSLQIERRDLLERLKLINSQMNETAKHENSAVYMDQKFEKVTNELEIRKSLETASERNFRTIFDAAGGGMSVLKSLSCQHYIFYVEYVC